MKQAKQYLLWQLFEVII